jgi:hypothetical protein
MTCNVVEYLLPMQRVCINLAKYGVLPGIARRIVLYLTNSGPVYLSSGTGTDHERMQAAQAPNEVAGMRRCRVRPFEPK